MQLERAKTIAEEIKALLEPACGKIVVAGSIRRQKPEVSDIELLCIPKFINGVDQLDREIGALMVLGVLGFRLNKRGSRVYGPKNKLLVHKESGIGIDVFSTDELCWPVALVVRTGGKMTNMEIATRAIERGMRFHAYGRGFARADGSELICQSEEEVFKAVGLRYLPPEERK